MSASRFILLALTGFRLQRIVTRDEWPPAELFRNWLVHRTGDESGWSILFTCAWCFGFHVVVALFTFDHFFPIPDLILYIGAGSAIVGMLGTYDFRP